LYRENSLIEQDRLQTYTFLATKWKRHVSDGFQILELTRPDQIRSEINNPLVISHEYRATTSFRTLPVHSCDSHEQAHGQPFHFFGQIKAPHKKRGEDLSFLDSFFFWFWLHKRIKTSLYSLSTGRAVTAGLALNGGLLDLDGGNTGQVLEVQRLKESLLIG
jgi:hypothetical protein